MTAPEVSEARVCCEPIRPRCNQLSSPTRFILKSFIWRTLLPPCKFPGVSKSPCVLRWFEMQEPQQLTMPLHVACPNGSLVQSCKLLLLSQIFLWGLAAWKFCLNPAGIFEIECVDSLSQLPQSFNQSTNSHVKILPQVPDTVLSEGYSKLPAQAWR